MDCNDQMKDFEIRLLSMKDMESYISDFQKMDMQYLSETPELQFLYQTIIEKFDKLGGDEKVIIGAFWDKHLVGCIEIEAVDDMNNCAELAIEVTDEYQHKGIGTTLMNEAIRLCQKSHYSSLTLLVRDDNTVARKLYNECGFVENGMIKNISEKDMTKYFIRMNRTL